MSEEFPLKRRTFLTLNRFSDHVQLGNKKGESSQRNCNGFSSVLRFLQRDQPRTQRIRLAFRTWLAAMVHGADAGCDVSQAAVVTAF